VGIVPLFFLRKVGLARKEDAIRELAARVVSSRGLELVGVEVKRGRGSNLVRLFVDKEGGIGLDELQLVSEEVSPLLDAEDPLDSAYTLEVSSPGLDRPLSSLPEYRRFVGRLVKLSSYEPVGGRRHWTGRLVSVSEDGRIEIRLEKEGGSVATIPYDKISHGRLEVEF
jgi:ribosome maturation factor RimP